MYLDDDSVINTFSQMLWGKEIHSFYPHQIKKSEKMNRICLGCDAQLMDDIDERNQQYTQELGLIRIHVPPIIFALGEILEEDVDGRWRAVVACHYS